MPYSNCCNAYTDMEELGICPDCKDHCDFEEECDECKGSGEKNGFPAMCDKCEGSGMIPIKN